MIIPILLSIYFKLHIFQLCGYKYQELFHYEIRHWINFLLRLGLVILYLINVPLLILLIPSALLTIYPRYIHKKVVYTKRMIRLIAMNIIIAAILIHFDKLSLLLFPELVLLIASILLYPLERAINRRYLHLAKKKRFNGIIIGITGSYGKTSTKMFIKKVLEMEYNVLATPSSFNTPLGISKVINNDLNDMYDFFIVEMGASHVGDIDELMDIITPDYSIITSIGNQHLQTFKSKKNIYNEKIKILNNKTYINFVNSEIDIAKRYYSFGDDGDCYAENIFEDQNGLSFDILCNEERYHLKTKIHGYHNVSNLLCSFMVGRFFGVPPAKICYALENMEAVANRLKIIDNGEEVIIDDSFNSNITGALNAIDTLLSMPGKKIIITPGFVELGKDNEYGLNLLAKKCNLCDVKIIVKNKKLYQKIPKSIFVKNFRQAMKEYKKIEGRKALLIENDWPDNY